MVMQSAGSSTAPNVLYPQHKPTWNKEDQDRILEAFRWTGSFSEQGKKGLNGRDAQQFVPMMFSPNPQVQALSSLNPYILGNDLVKKGSERTGNLPNGRHILFLLVQ